VKVVILGSCGLDGIHRQYASSYLVNGAVAIDAGCLGFRGTPEEQRAVRHLFLTHPHADHTASLPFFIENVWTPTGHCPTVYGSSETLATIRRHIFNDEVWPDFVAMSERVPPFLRFRNLQVEIPVAAEGLTITPVAVNHLVPTFAYIVRDDQGSAIFAADTGPTTRLWEIAHQEPALRAVFLEASFPNRMTAVAEASLHLTPSMLAQEIAKLPPGIRVIAVHLKIAYQDEIRDELNKLGIAQLEIGECEREYLF
jgi:cAMP phosphodiesterase